MAEEEEEAKTMRIFSAQQFVPINSCTSLWGTNFSIDNILNGVRIITVINILLNILCGTEID